MVQILRELLFDKIKVFGWFLMFEANKSYSVCLDFSECFSNYETLFPTLFLINRFSVNLHNFNFEQSDISFIRLTTLSFCTSLISDSACLCKVRGNQNMRTRKLQNVQDMTHNLKTNFKKTPT